MRVLIKAIFAVSFQFALLQAAQCSRILVWETMGAPSHMMAMDAFVRGLAKNNHSITYVAYTVPKWLSEEKNIEFVHVGFDGSKMINDVDVFNWNPFTGMANFLSTDYFIQVQRDAVSNPILKGHIENGTKFDLTIITSSAIDVGLYYARKIFKTPLVFFASGFTDPSTSAHMGNPINPSYISAEMADAGSKMSFFERVQNTLIIPFMTGMQNLILFIWGGEIKTLLNDENVDLQELASTADMFIVNQHPLFDKARPLNPNTVTVGGIHIKENRTKLPEEIQDWLDGAEHGVIYVSLGSVTQGSRMPQEKREAMISAFSKLKERILWKWETEEMPNKPENVLLKKWCPQQDILAHPNVKLFVTHGGLLSTYESVYFGIPMLVLPGFADQFANAHFVRERGLGDRMRWSEVNHQSFETKLLTILNGQEYKDKAAEYSEIFKDEPMKPVDKAVFYAEYVIRHRGAAHLRPSSKDLYWFQYFLLDIALFFVAIMVLAFLALRACFRLVKRCLCGRDHAHKKMD